MYQFSARHDTLHFDFPEGQIDFNEVLQALGQAGRISLREAMPIRVTISGMDEIGMIEARHTPGRVYPPVCLEDTTILHLPPDHGYDLFVCPKASPFYRICIPGVMDSIDQHILAVAPEFAATFDVSIARTVFNVAVGAFNFVTNRTAMPRDWQVFPDDYNNIRSYRDMLAKKPRVRKPVDFAAILVSLFGEKIATAILKEIK